MKNNLSTPLVRTAKWAASALSAVAMTVGMTGAQAQQVAVHLVVVLSGPRRAGVSNTARAF